MPLAHTKSSFKHEISALVFKSYKISQFSLYTGTRQYLVTFQSCFLAATAKAVNLAILLFGYYIG